MTVDEPVRTPGSFLIDDVPPIFYNAPIPYKHWQLRSLLCSPSPNVLYYPNDSQIYSLNTTTREQSLVANLHFEPRCIGAKYGWVCAGGVENGQFAAVQVSSADSRTTSESVTRKSSRECVGDARAVDELENLEEYMVGTRAGRLAKYVRLTEMGGSIVNSITLHRPLDAKGDEDIVAVVTNNDKTVRIFSLSNFQLLTTLHLPFHTNHASISPDGQHLVVVGDSSKVYFYRPSRPHLHLHSSKDRKATHSAWTLSSDLPLTTGSEALISTHFSPSSALCSVASQDGSVTVFDIQRLMREEVYGYDDRYSPIIEVIPSSRPRSQVGAVRSVQFSPAPWDLLVWAEHTGRVSITDVRTGFCRRQIIDVVAAGDSILEKPISRAGGGGEVLCDYDPLPRETPPGDYDLPDLLSGSAFVRRSSSSHGPNLAALEPSTSADGPTSDDDDSYITSMRSFLNTRRQLDELIHADPGTTHVAPTVSTEWPILASAWRGNSSTSPLTSPTFTPTSATLTTTSATFPPTSASTGHIRPIPILPTRLDYTEQLDRLSRQNRRRLDLVASSTAAASSPVPDNRTPEERYQRARERLARLEYIRRAHLTQNTLPAWSGAASGAGSGSSSRRPVYLPAFGASGSGSGSGRRNRSSGEELDITGCTMSCDGRKLYVATTAGILEYAIDLTARRVFPRVQPR